MRNFIEWLSTRFVDGFGTPSCFAICTALLIAWLALIPILGLGHWNATVGLGGNTAESTVELFLEVAILIVARRVDVAQAAAKSQRDEADKKRDDILGIVERMEEEHGKVITELQTLIRELHAGKAPPK